VNRRTDAVRQSEVGRLNALKEAMRRGGAEHPERLLAKLLTVQEAAEMLAMPVGTLRNLTHRREIPVVKVGSQSVRYRFLDLLDWIEQRSRPALG